MTFIILVFLRALGHGFLEIFVLGKQHVRVCFLKAQHHLTFVLRHLAHHHFETHLGFGSDPLRYLEDDSNLGQQNNRRKHGVL